jgi:NAD(P)-dependent dehydrogenase (short-subunit alcohol dehydrogenase family)
MGALDGRVALVTGGARGIGVEYCVALASAGADVIATDIVDPSPTVARLTQEGHAALGLAADVADEAQVRALAAKAAGWRGRIDILVNNAALFATLTPVDVIDLDVATWDRVMAVNVRGTFLMVKHVAPHMIARRYGKIVNITSGVAYKGLAGMTHYASSKGAITTMSRSLARELGPHGICVNSLAPGAIMSDTIMANETQMKAHVASAASRAIRRDAYPADLVGALVFLCSQASDFVTGQTLAVDGGSIYT